MDVTHEPGATREFRPFTADLLARIKKHGPLKRLTSQHQRSFHLTHKQAGELVDSPNDSDYSLKGLPDDTPKIQWLGLESDPSRFRIEGLVPRGETRRAKMKQDFLLAHGLPTEKFLEIYDLTEVPDHAEWLPQSSKRGGWWRRSRPQEPQRVEKPPLQIDEWKRRVIEQLEFRRTHSDDEYFNQYTGKYLVAWRNISPSDVDRVIDYIRRTDYVVVLREQPVEASFVDIQETAEQDTYFSAAYSDNQVTVYVNNERVKFSNVRSFERNIPDLVKKFKSNIYNSNFSDDDATNAYRSMIPCLRARETATGNTEYYHTYSTYFTERMLESAFRSINTSERYRGNPLLPEGGFDVTNAEHIRHFIQNFTPVNMAEYLADVHALGISHGYAHGQNWKLGVFLMDLDSMKGTPFGDPEPTDADRKNDVQRSIHAIDTLLSLDNLGPFKPSLNHSYVANKFLELNFLVSEHDKIFAMRKEAICQFLARYLQRQTDTITRDTITTFLADLDIKEFKDKDGDYHSNPPISKIDYGNRILQLVTDEKG